MKKKIDYDDRLFNVTLSLVFHIFYLALLMIFASDKRNLFLLGLSIIWGIGILVHIGLVFYYSYPARKQTKSYYEEEAKKRVPKLIKEIDSKNPKVKDKFRALIRNAYYCDNSEIDLYVDKSLEYFKQFMDEDKLMVDEI